MFETAGGSIKLCIHTLGEAVAGQELDPFADAGEARRGTVEAVRRVYAQVLVVSDVVAVLLAVVVESSYAALKTH